MMIPAITRARPAREHPTAMPTTLWFAEVEGNEEAVFVLLVVLVFVESLSRVDVVTPNM
jgi:hypothetical protein